MGEIDPTIMFRRHIEGNAIMFASRYRSLKKFLMVIRKEGNKM